MITVKPCPLRRIVFCWCLPMLVSELNCALVTFAAEPTNDSLSWIEPMRKVHARFTGVKGTFAYFGDSITVTMAFWSPLAGNPKNMSPEMAHAHQLVKAF